MPSVLVISKNRILPLFGHKQRTAFIIGIALHGPIRARELGRILSIDPSRLPGFTRDFIKLGVINRDNYNCLVLDEQFFAYEELAILLNAMGKRRVIVLPDTTTAKGPENRVPLFCNTNVTNVLIALSMLGSANVKDLALVAGVDDPTARYTVRRLEHWGVVVTERIGADRTVTFDNSNPIIVPLMALLTRMQAPYKGMKNRAAAQRYLLTERHRLADPANRLDLALPFGTELQQRTLVALARYDTLTTATLAKIIGVSQSTARTLAVGLAEYGLTVCQTFGGGPQRKRWIALNAKHPLTAAIKAYAKARTEATSPPPSTLPLPPRSFRGSAPVKSRELPGHPLRTAVLIGTFETNEIDVVALAKRMGRSNRKSIRRWAEELAADGLIEYGPINGKMTLRVRHDGPGAAALSALVRKMVWFTSRR